MQKETKGHSKNEKLFATKADLKETESHLSVEILATKYDLKEVRNELKREIKEIELRLKAEFQKEVAPIHKKIAVIDERTKTYLNTLLLVVMGVVLAPLVISLFPTLIKLLS